MRIHPFPSCTVRRIPSLAVFLALAGCGQESEAPSQRPVTTPALDPAYLQEMEAIGADPRVREAFAFIEVLEEPSVQDLVYLTEIPAPPFMEEARAAAYAEMLREAGADSVWLDEVGNVLGLRRGTVGGRAVALDGHLDTVFPEETDVTVRFRGDTLFAPGVGDDARGLIVVRNVLKTMVALDLRTEADLLFIGTVGEEGLGDLRGVKHLFREDGPRIDAFIAVDGGDDSRIVNQGVGSLRYRVTFKGPGGHSWGAFGLANPHNALSAAIRHFVAAADQHTRSGPRTSYNVGRIGGGTSINSIPFESWMELDMRSLDPESLAELDGHFQEAVRKGLEEENALRRRGDPLTVDVEMVGNRPAGLLDPSTTPLIQRSRAAVRYQGKEPGLGSSSTNANIPISLGIPAISIGRGGHGGGAHSLDEWWLDVDGHLAVQNALLVVLAEGGFPR
jgi:acetylornithine deacetylase/succinyl-diaminopimelate desuccinylase-like protein